VLAYKRRKKPMEIERERERELQYFRTKPPKGEEKRGKKKEIGGKILQGRKRDSS